MRTIMHPAAVSAVAFGPVGHDLVSGAVDGSLLVTSDGREPIVLSRSAGGIDAAALLADGRVIATDTRRHLRIAAPDGSPIADLAMAARATLLRPSMDGRGLVTVPSYTDAASPALWDLGSYRLVTLLDGHVGQVRAARWVRDERQILTSGGDGTARLWDGPTGKLLQTYRGGPRFLVDATVDPSGEMIVAGDADGLLRFWNAPTGRPLWTLPAHRSHVVGIHFEGVDLVTRGFGGEVSRWTLPAAGSVIAEATRKVSGL